MTSPAEATGYLGSQLFPGSPRHILYPHFKSDSEFLDVQTILEDEATVDIAWRDVAKDAARELAVRAEFHGE